MCVSSASSSMFFRCDSNPSARRDNDVRSRAGWVSFLSARLACIFSATAVNPCFALVLSLPLNCVVSHSI